MVACERKRNFFYYFNKLIALLALVFIAFSFFVFVFSFFKPVNDFFVSQTINLLSKSIEGQVNFESVRLNPFFGFRIDGLAISSGGDTVLSARSIMLDWDICSFPTKKILVKRAFFEQLYVNLTKEKGEEQWNFEKLLKQSEDTTSGEPPDLTIEVRKFKILNSHFKIRNYNEEVKNCEFDPENFELSNLQLELNGKISLRKFNADFEIQNFSFVEKLKEFQVNKITCKGSYNDSNLVLDDFILSTPKTNLELSSKMNFNSITHLVFKINPSEVNFDDVKKFVCLPIEDKRTYKLSGIVDIGSEIKFTNIELQLNRTNLVFDGRFYEKFDSIPSLDLDFGSLNVIQSDVSPILKSLGIEIPVDFAFVNSNRFLFSFVGDKYFARGRIKTKLGEIDLDFSTPKEDFYSVNAELRNFNISSLVSEIPSNSLNGKISTQFEINEGLQNGFVRASFDGNLLGSIDYNSFELLINAKIDRNLIYFDTVSLVFLPTENNFELGYININSQVDLRSKGNIKYSGNVGLNQLKPQSIFSKYADLPQKISGEFKFEGIGLDIETMDLKLNSNVEELEFVDRALFPFDLNLEIHHSNALKKSIEIHSPILDGFIEGQYRVTDLIRDLLLQFQLGIAGIEKKFDFLATDSVNDSVTDQAQDQPNPKGKGKQKPIEFSETNFRAKFNIKDFSIVSFFINQNLNFSGKLDISYSGSKNKSTFLVDSLLVDNFYFASKDTITNKLQFEVSARDLKFSSKFCASIFDNIPVVDTLDLMMSSNSRIFVNKLEISEPTVEVYFVPEKVSFLAEAGINDIVSFSTRGTSQFDSIGANVFFDTLTLSYEKIFQWSSAKKFNLMLTKNAVFLKDFALLRENAEAISLDFVLSNQEQVRLIATIDHLPINDFQKVIPVSFLQNSSRIDGTIDSIRINVVGKLESPQISLQVNSKKIYFQDFEINDLICDLDYENRSLEGKISVSSSKNSNLELLIYRFPIWLNFKDFEFDLLKGESFGGKLSINSIPLNLFSTFAADYVDNLQGESIGEIEIFGYLPEDIRLSGQLRFNNGKFNLKYNNLNYDFSGNVLFTEGKITFESFEVKNSPNDLKFGKAEIFGGFSFANNRVRDISISLKTDAFKVLSNASIKTSPNLYGDLVISTWKKGITIFGNPSDLTLEGYVNIVKANLFLPSAESRNTVSESFVTYEISSPQLQSTEVKSTDRTDEYENYSTNSNLKIDLLFSFENPAILTVDLTAIGQIYAKITLDDKSSTLRFYSNPKENVTYITGGDLILREGSTLKLIKLFRTEGKINFPTGRIDNPGFDLRAEYTGQNYFNDNVRNFVVTIYLTGTRERPNIRFDYKIDNQQAVGDSAKVSQDALFLLAFGRTKTEMEQSRGGAPIDFNDLSFSGTSALFSKFATEALSSTGFISSADISFEGNTLEALDRAKLKMSGTFLGLTWNFGGTIADLISNNEISVEMPFGLLINQSYLRNLILQLSRTTNLTQSNQRFQKEWEIKMKYGTSW